MKNNFSQEYLSVFEKIKNETEKRIEKEQENAEKNKIKYKPNKTLLRTLEATTDKDYIECILIIYKILNKKVIDKNIKLDIDRDVISKNKISYKNLIWYFDCNRNIAINYDTKEIVWNRKNHR